MKEMAFIKNARTVMVRGRLMLAFDAMLGDGHSPQIISCDTAKVLFELDNSRRPADLDYTLIWVQTGATGGVAMYDGPYDGVK